MPKRSVAEENNARVRPTGNPIDPPTDVRLAVHHATPAGVFGKACPAAPNLSVPKATPAGVFGKACPAAPNLSVPKASPAAAPAIDRLANQLPDRMAKPVGYRSRSTGSSLPASASSHPQKKQAKSLAAVCRVRCAPTPNAFLQAQRNPAQKVSNKSRRMSDPPALKNREKILQNNRKTNRRPAKYHPSLHRFKLVHQTKTEN